MLKKTISLTLSLVMLLALGTTVFATSTTSTSVRNILDDIIEYSSYDYPTGRWILDHAIVDDGILTETQYDDAEEIGNYYAELFSDENEPQTRVLPAAVVLVLKAIAAAGGAALAAEIVSDIYNYGMTVACENFTGVEMFQDFCRTNGYI